MRDLTPVVLFTAAAAVAAAPAEALAEGEPCAVVAAIKTKADLPAQWEDQVARRLRQEGHAVEGACVQIAQGDERRTGHLRRARESFSLDTGAIEVTRETTHIQFHGSDFNAAR